MKDEDAKRYVQVDPSMDDRVSAHARDAMRDLWDRTVDNATLDPRSRLITPAMVKAAVEERLRDYTGAGVLLPQVDVCVNADRTGFDVKVKPAVVPAVMRQVR